MPRLVQQAAAIHWGGDRSVIEDFKPHDIPRRWVLNTLPDDDEDLTARLAVLRAEIAALLDEDEGA